MLLCHAAHLAMPGTRVQWGCDPSMHCKAEYLAGFDKPRC